MSEAEEAIIKQEGRPYVTVFVSDSEVIADENEEAQVMDSRQIIVHSDDSVAVEDYNNEHDYNDIRCVLAQESDKFEGTENEDLSSDTSRTLWTRNNVKLLINEYKALKNEFQDPRRKQKDLWAIVSARLSEKIAKETGESNAWMSSQVTWDACDRKWRNLKHTFRTIHHNQWRSFRSRSRWEFYTPLLDVFGNTMETPRDRPVVKPEKTRYVVVHPPNLQSGGGRAIMIPSLKKHAHLVRSGRPVEISPRPPVISAEDVGSNEDSVFLEEVKGSPGFMVMKSSKVAPSETPVKKQVKLSHVVQGQVKISESKAKALLAIQKDSETVPKCSTSKSKEEVEMIDEKTVDRLDASTSKGATDVSSSPPAWFVNFLKEYQEEERKRRESLKKAHEELLRVEERKVRALENILSKIVSGQASNPEKPSDSQTCSENPP
ncbi:uncharacterized protein LOC124169332 [Ischnura elegans]|uniref:uncharacterized protein LOC124169332 n=1 Tax=Ischnura elegans TaxID=197161 RepID=UPI001ED8BA8B|nr:uncharacterized protein LOC124169332 [Ischnura elegans]